MVLVDVWIMFRLQEGHAGYVLLWWREKTGIKYSHIVQLNDYIQTHF